MKKIYSLIFMLMAFVCLPWGSSAWAAQSLPYSYGFEDYNLATDGWTTQNPSGRNSGEFKIYGQAKKTGSYGFRFSSFSDNGENTQYLISPELNAASGLTLTFSYKAYSAYGTETFKVGYSTTNTDISSFTFGDEISTSSTVWQEYENVFPAGTKYIAVYYYANYQYRLYVDDFTFAAPPSCMQPTITSAAATSTTEATISWNKGGSETQWQYLCLPASTELEDSHWASATSTSSQSVNLTSLESGANYIFYLRSDCGSTDGTSTPASAAFVTLCAAKSAPYSIGFETSESCTAGELPVCWSKIGNPSIIANSGYTTYSHNGTQVMHFNGTDEQYVVLPQFDQEVKNLQISFWYKHYYYTYYPSNLVLGSMTDPTDKSTFTVIKALEQTNDYLQVNNFALSGAKAGDYYIAFKYTASDSYAKIMIDDITVSEAPSCLAPVSLSASSISSNSASISWTAGASESAWVLQYQEDGGSWSSDIAVSTTPSHALSGLNPSTNYNVRVKANCGGDYSDWSSTGSFRTECGAVTTFPWNNTFDELSADLIPECWSNAASTATSSWGAEYMWGTYKSSGNTMLRMYNAYISAGGEAIIRTPLITLPNETDFEFLFDYCHKATCGAMDVKISVNGGDFVTLGSYSNTSGSSQTYPSTFTTESFSLATYANKTIQFQFSASPDYNNGAIFIDNIIVRKAPTCFKPTALTIGAISSNSADLSWTAGKDESAWKVQYKADGAADWSEKAVSTTPACTLTGLSANTGYTVQVIANCGSGDESEASAQQSFTTLCAAKTMPWSESFSSSTMPNCWEAVSASTTYKWDMYSQYQSGAYNYNIRLRTGSSGTATLQTPPIALSEDAVLKFDWKSASSPVAIVNLYVSTDGGTSKTLLSDDLTNTYSDYTEKTYDLSAYTGENVVIYFISTFSTTNKYAYLDNIQVIAKPCDVLTNVNVASTLDGGTVTWTGNAKKLQYRAGTSGEWTSVVIADADKAKPYTITGLSTSAAYQVRVLAVCGDESVESNWTSPVAFTTRCEAISTLPYENNFESESYNVNVMPSCWEKVTTSDNFPQVAQGSLAYGGEGNFVQFSGIQDQIAVLPAFSADLNTLTIQFYYRYHYADFQLGYVLADGMTFVSLETLTQSASYSEVPYEKDLAAIPAEAKYLAFRMTNATSASAQACVDNLVVKETPTCFKPTNLNTSAVSTNGATMTWDASTGGSETQYQYCVVASGATPSEWTLLANGVRTVAVTSLLPATEYDFYVRSYCGAIDQSDAIKTSFTTGCAAINALPWDADFSIDLSACWTRHEENPLYYYSYTFNNELRMTGGKSGGSNLLVLPDFNADLSNASLTLHYKCDAGSGNASPEVGYLTDRNDKTTFVSIASLDKSASKTYAFVPLNTAGTNPIAIRYAGSGSSEGTLTITELRVSHVEVFEDRDDASDNESRLSGLSSQTMDVVLTRSIWRNGDYGTISLPFSLSAAQLADEKCPLNGFVIREYKESEVAKNDADGTVDIYLQDVSEIGAGKAYFVRHDGSLADLSPLIFRDVTISCSAPQHIEDGSLKLYGLFNPLAVTANQYEVLFVGAGNQLFYPNVDGFIKGFRAYFNVPNSSPLAPIIRRGAAVRIVEQKNTATGIEDVQRDDVQCTKELREGTLFILHGEKIYNAQGQLVK